MIEKISKVQLLAIRESQYTVYVFKNLEDGEYIMCTRLPNWKTPNINISDIGYLQYQIVKAGDVYYDPNTDQKIKYNYSNIYFINFIDEKELVKNKEIIL